MVKKIKARTEPLLVRKGAHYTCFGDGLCCTDLHGLGPLTEDEIKRLVVISDEVVAHADESGFDEPMLRTRSDGGCLFLSRDRCELHAALGADEKPEGCRRFPLGLTATPAGGRVTTKHRCPCRTMGDRPEITADAAAPSLIEEGKLKSDRSIPRNIEIENHEKVPFVKYQAIEGKMLRRLAKGDDPAKVLDYAPFPELVESDWLTEAEEMMDDGADDTRFGVALGWFAQSIRALQGEEREPQPLLPWEDAFDRAEARSPEPGDPDRIVADWVADVIWAMEWTDIAEATFDDCRAELATRLAICQDLRAILEKAGRRPDRAAAEAVSIVDLVGDSEWWEEIVTKMVS